MPEDVEKPVYNVLLEKGAIVEKINRTETGGGDPCYRAFRYAVSQKGWVPFSCSGNDNWSNIEGGQTIGWEMIMQLTDNISGLIIQAGGGALARAMVQAWEEFYQMGLVGYLPKIYVCQPEGGFPFVRAYYLILKKIADQNGLAFDFTYNMKEDPKTELQKVLEFSSKNQSQIRNLIEFIKANYSSTAVQNVLTHIPHHRNAFMWPWDGDAPHSLAHGILDDETYDWYYLLLGVLKTGGKGEILLEQNIEKAYEMSKAHTDISVSPTGASGLAGLMQLEDKGYIDRTENIGLFFTGMDRNPE